MLCFALTADAWVSALRGELDRARSAGAEAMALLDGLDESVLSRATRVHVAAAQLEAGEPEGCLAAMSAGGAPEFAGVEPGRRAWLYAILARAELALGRPGAAADWVQRGEAAADGLGLPYAEAVRALCPRAARRHDVARWSREARAATRRSARAGRPSRGRARRLGRRGHPGVAGARSSPGAADAATWRCSSGPSPTSAASAPPGCATRPRASCAGSA